MPVNLSMIIKEKLIPMGTQVALSETGGLRAEILKNQIREKYPDFDIDANEDKVASILNQRYNKDYIKRNSLKLISEAVEEIGGKKGKTSAKIPHTEEPTTTSAITSARKKEADAIRDRIRKVNVGSADIAQIK